MCSDPALARLYRAEYALRRRCTALALRLELAACAVLLLELACHADAALEDLATLAEPRGVRLPTRGAALASWLLAVLDWVRDAFRAAPEGGYRSVLADAQRGIGGASALAAEAAGRRDGPIARWCDTWIEQRGQLVARLDAALLDAAAASARVASFTSPAHPRSAG